MHTMIDLPTNVEFDAVHVKFDELSYVITRFKNIPYKMRPKWLRIRITEDGSVRALWCDDDVWRVASVVTRVDGSFKLDIHPEKIPVDKHNAHVV